MYIQNNNDHLPNDPSQKTRKELSLLSDTPFGDCRLLTITVVFFVFGLYFRSFPLSSPANINCLKSLFIPDKLLYELERLVLLL